MQPDIDVIDIADKADMIVNGYAFTKDNEWVRVLNLNFKNHAAVILDDKIVETNMNDVENEIVMDYYRHNKQFMEE